MEQGVDNTLENYSKNLLDVPEVYDDNFPKTSFPWPLSFILFSLLTQIRSVSVP